MFVLACQVSFVPACAHLVDPRRSWTLFCVVFWWTTHCLRYLLNYDDVFKTWFFQSCGMHICSLCGRQLSQWMAIWPLTGMLHSHHTVTVNLWIGYEFCLEKHALAIRLNHIMNFFVEQNPQQHGHCTLSYLTDCCMISL